MRKMLALSALAATFAFAAGGAQSQELLVNGDFGNPAVPGEAAVGWTVDEGPLNTAMPPALANAASFAGFADHTTPGADNAGLWLKAFTGSQNATAPPLTFAHVTQTVAGLPGQNYTLSAWSRFETHYAGGVDNLNDGAPEAIGESTTDGVASPTDTFLAIDFLDALSSVIGTSSIELRADGQVNSATPLWRQHFVSGASPLGTAFVRARTSMTDGQINPGVNPQSAFMDDFSLTAVAIPEPATAALLGVGLMGLAAIGRRK